MKISRVRIKNFRSYKNEAVIDFGNFTALVGRNDIGKSAILEALDIFFNDGSGAVKIDREDINVQATSEGDNEAVIAVCFSDLPKTVIIDETVSTTLKGEFMLNSDGRLEVVKKYRLSGKNSVSVSTFIMANHPANLKCSDLLQKKNSNLRAIIKAEVIECSNLNINSEMRRAIWDHFANYLDCRETEIDASKEDAKKIWDKLSAYMPVYSLFKADRENSDKDSEVQDPLKEAVKQILREEGLLEELNNIAARVTDRLREVSSRTLEKLREIDSEVASTLSPVIPDTVNLRWAEVFKDVSIAGDDNIPVRKRGSGIKRLVLISFFRAEAERKSAEKNYNGIIYAIEEPETSQHPRSQRLLVEALKSMVQNNAAQVIITTHSPFIVKELELEDIRIIHEHEGMRDISNAEFPVLQYQSLNEVIYIAFGEATEEYHDELYGIIVSKEWLTGYEEGKPTRPYIDDRNPDKRSSYTLTRYIRHQIHHPENHRNEPFTRDELRQSIDDMRSYIANKNSKE